MRQLYKIEDCVFYNTKLTGYLSATSDSGAKTMSNNYGEIEYFAIKKNNKAISICLFNSKLLLNRAYLHYPSDQTGFLPSCHVCITHHCKRIKYDFISTILEIDDFNKSINDEYSHDVRKKYIYYYLYSTFNNHPDLNK